jgi:L-iditol 2-dehydrogenase
MAAGSMRVAVLRGVGDVVTEERAVPRPGPGEVLVKVAAVGVCGSDTHYFDHGRIGRFVVDQPLVLGHEASGEIVELGPGVTGRKIGDRVSIEPGRPDFTCEQCLAGRYNLCPDMRFFATPPIDGAFAELVVVHQAMAHVVPDSVSDEAAALLEPLSVAVWACGKGAVGAGSRVLVTGAGAIGLLCASARGDPDRGLRRESRPSRGRVRARCDRRDRRPYGEVGRARLVADGVARVLGSSTRGRRGHPRPRRGRPRRTRRHGR